MSKFRKSQTQSSVVKKPLVVGLSGVLLSLLVVYVWQINALATTGYKIKSLEKSVSQLKLEKRQMEGRVLKAQSIDSIQSQIEQLALSSAPKMEFIAPQTNLIAQK